MANRMLGVTKDYLRQTFEQSMNSSERTEWWNTMKNEVDILRERDALEPVKCPLNVVPIDSGWSLKLSVIQVE